MARNESFFQRLTRLFRSGPAIQRHVKGHNVGSYYDTSVARSRGQRAPSPQGFGRENSPYSTLGSYGIMDRMMRYGEFHEMEYSLHPDTKIAVPGGYKTIKQLADECKNHPEHTFIVYSYDHNKNKIVPAVGRQARKTCHDEAYRITFDNGTSVIGSFNHRLMKRDGTYSLIKDLKPGDAMMPFYRRSVATDRTEGRHNQYQAIYTINREDNPYGWTAEHKLLAEFVLGRKLKRNEVVHHKNFLAHDNRIENLEVMDKTEQQRFHAEIINGKKWDYEKNGNWIEAFKKRHSAWMKENNPAERRDIGFWDIVFACEEKGFNLTTLCNTFDTDPNVIKRKLKKHGFDNFEKFASAYCSDYQPTKYRRKPVKFSIQELYSKYEEGDSLNRFARKLEISSTTLLRSLQRRGYGGFTDFKKKYENLKVLSVEPMGKMDLYDLTVDGYKNFATDSVISHNTPEIASALDIYSDEVVGGDQHGKAFHIFSNNVHIQNALEELFNDTLNIEFNLRAWVRNLVKFGDFFLYNEVLPDIGIINAQPIPVDEIEREDGYDEEDPYAVRFKWVNRGQAYLENWQVTHMRILGNDLFLPYGTSVLEPARRIWRQLIMMEDAMLVYRVVRSPERRVFYIDVANVAPNDVPSYMEAAKATLRSQNVMENQTGRQDMRYNPLAVDEDYYIPVRGNQSGTKIDTLAGGQHVTATEDVEYIQSKLFAALKVPKPYLNYDENLSSKATLAQEDVRFSRTVQSIQKIVTAELNKMAMIHLFAKGFEGEDLIDFELKLSNPSTVALQQKLELWSTKMDIAGTAKDTKLVDERWIQKNLLELTDDDIDKIEKGLYEDKVREVQLDSIEFEEEPQKKTTTDAFDQTNYGEPHQPPAGAQGQGSDTQQTQQTADQSDVDSSAAIPRDRGNPYTVNYQQGKPPIKATPFLTRHKKNRSRRLGYSGRDQTANPDFAYMTSGNRNRSLRDIYDQEFLNNPTQREGVFERDINVKTNVRLPSEVRSILRRLQDHLSYSKAKKGLLTEEIELEDDISSPDEDDNLLNAILDENKTETTGSLKEALSPANEGQESDENEKDDDDDDDSVEFELE